MIGERARDFLKGELDTMFSRATDYCETRREFKERCEDIDELAAAHGIDIWDDGRTAVEAGLKWWDSRCPDCGDDNQTMGHQGCMYPGAAGGMDPS